MNVRIGSVAVAAVLSVTLLEPLSSQRLPNGAPATWEVAEELPPEARQFDFWVGEWDVNLRIHQPDGSWQDAQQAEARIYPILSGKAVLELWESTAIKGFSVRYFDTDQRQWVLWLNWPGPNRSGSSSLTGTFRHGRGDFYSTRQAPDGSEVTSRYSFNDITPHSLRWDDGYSEDGGSTWQGRWIMEWTRTAAQPSLPPRGGPAHTYRDGSLCTAAEFDRYTWLAGRRTGEAKIDGPDGVSVTATLTGYSILDGCAVMAFIASGETAEAADRFAHVTWNAGADRYELLLLSSDARAPAHLLFSDPAEVGLLFTDQVSAGADEDSSVGAARGATVRVRLEERPDGRVGWTEERRPGGAGQIHWQPTLSGVFGSAAPGRPDRRLPAPTR